MTEVAKTKELVSRIQPLSSSALKLSDLKLEANAKEAESVVNLDPILVGRILKVANSPLFGISEGVESIGKAITILGLQQVKAISLSLSLWNSIPKKIHGYGITPKEFQFHSIAVGVLACHLRKGTSIMPFSAGLLHDIGKILLSAHLAEHPNLESKFSQALTSMSVLQAEKEILGKTHCEASLELCENWGFPAPVIRAVCDHHKKEGRLQGKAKRLSDVIHVANGLSKLIGYGEGARYLTDELDYRIFHNIGIDEGFLNAVGSKVKEMVDNFANALNGSGLTDIKSIKER